MRNFSRILALGILSGFTLVTFAQTKPTSVPVGKPANLTPAEIIKQFTQRESELQEVWKEYSYKQESRFQALGPADIVSGEFYQLSEFVFNDSGKRLERILKAPPNTLDRAGLTMTLEDRNALTNLQPFALTAEELPNYNLTYVGPEKVDELNTYVFDVVPKAMTDPRALNKLKDQKIEGKYFQGRIWVDDQDLQVVKVAGKVVPEFKQRFPKFETYRENIDGRYWFPTFTTGVDRLYFDGGSIKVRLVVKYKDYRQFQSDVKITSVEETEVKDEPAAKPSTGGNATPTTGSGTTTPTTTTTTTTAKPAEKKVDPATEKKPEPEKPKRPRPTLK